MLERLSKGFVLDIGFIDHFHTRLVTTFIYSAIANFHTLQSTKTQAPNVFISSCLVAGPTMVILQLPCSSPV
jgi:hypothetical protein